MPSPDDNHAAPGFTCDFYGQISGTWEPGWCGRHAERFFLNGGTGVLNMRCSTHVTPYLASAANEITREEAVVISVMES